MKGMALDERLKEKDAWDIYYCFQNYPGGLDNLIREFASRFDLVFFVSGKNSSNGKALFETCREVNRNTFFISSPGESDEIPVEDITSIGICGATSSPMWLLSAVKDRLSERLNIK